MQSVSLSPSLDKRLLTNLVFGKTPSKRMITKGPQGLVTFRRYQSDDRAWIEESIAHFYRHVHHYDTTFHDALATALDLLERRQSVDGSGYFVAEIGNRPVGCIFLSADGPDAGRIRLFYVEEAHRGRAIGGGLLRNVLTAAKEKNLATLRVSTFDRHWEACRLYEAFGFKQVKREPTRAFGLVMTQMDYELLSACEDL